MSIPCDSNMASFKDDTRINIGRNLPSSLQSEITAFTMT